MQLSAKKITCALVLITIALVIAHISLQYVYFSAEYKPFIWQLIQRFNVDHEASVPTWFSQTLLVIVSSLFALSGSVQKKGSRWHWYALSALFLYASVDEGSELHELAIEPIQKAFQIESGLLFFSWVIPALGIIALLLIVFARFYFNLPQKMKALFAASVLCIFGAIAIEMISGSYWQAQDFQYDMTYRLLNAAEEGFEMIAFILIIYALLNNLAKTKKSQQPKLEFIN